MGTIKSSYSTPTLSRAHNWAKLPCNLCVLGGSPKEGTESTVAPSPVPSKAPTNGHNCCVSRCVLRGAPEKGTKSEVPT